MRDDDPPPALGWPGILRLGLVQTALGAVVVLTTSAINRVMVVELALAATVQLSALVGGSIELSIRVCSAWNSGSNLRSPLSRAWSTVIDWTPASVQRASPE